ncbi:MAG: glutathione S-transferase family protein [Myxococcota bacterium]
MRLYDYLETGNGYECRLLLTLLGISFERIEVDIMKGETRTPEFLEINPNGRIPVLELDDGRTLSESGANLFYLAEGKPFLPDDRFERGEVLQWMFFEQYSHEPYVAVVRFWIHQGLTPEQQDQIDEKRKRGYEALDVMEQHLHGAGYVVGGRFSIADIALYAYTHVAHEGGFDLSGYPHIERWLARVREQPGHIPITQA